MKNYPILYDVNKIRFGKINSVEDILVLFKLIFFRNFQRELIEWYGNCPFGANRWYGAFENGRPIAMYGLLPIRIKLGDKIINGALCNNVGVIPEYQGKGLFQSIGEYALHESKFPLVVGVPNTKAVKGHKRIGWRKYGILELLSGETQKKELSSVDYGQFQYFPPKNESYFKVIKDQSFIKWRYAKPGTKYYQSFFADDYIIWKAYEDKKQVLDTNNYNLIFDLGGIVNIWKFAGTTQSDVLKNKGFKSILTNEFMLYTNFQVENNLNEYNFELGDNDVF